MITAYPSELRPNPSVNLRANGMAPSPQNGAVHHPFCGLGAMPLSPGYLER
jgi:hypothetical protein